MKTLTLMKCAYGTIRNASLHKFAKRICIMAAEPPLHICEANASFTIKMFYDMLKLKAGANLNSSQQPNKKTPKNAYFLYQYRKGECYMKIIFVRHGHPNYQDDCLTEIGHIQAETAAKRLKDTHIDKFFSSSCGRAYETACHIANLHNQEIEKLNFMREIEWGIPDTEDYIHPWLLVDGWVKNGKGVMDPDWQNDADYADHTVLNCYRKVAKNFDNWLSEFGFTREGSYYRITRKNCETVLLVSHGGSSSVVLSHIFNLPFSFVCHAIRPGFTAITEVSFEGEVGDLTSPRFDLVNDITHIKTEVDEIYYDN